MAKEPEKISVKVILEPDTVAQIDELAQALNSSRAAVAKLLVEASVRDNAWILKHIVAPLRKVLKRRGISGREVLE